MWQWIRPQVRTGICLLTGALFVAGAAFAAEKPAPAAAQAKAKAGVTLKDLSRAVGMTKVEARQVVAVMSAVTRRTLAISPKPIDASGLGLFGRQKKCGELYELWYEAVYEMGKAEACMDETGGDFGGPIITDEGEIRDFYDCFDDWMKAYSEAQQYMAEIYASDCNIQ